VIRPIVARHGYAVALGTLLAAIAVLVGVILVDIAVPELQRAGIIGATPVPAASAQPTASLEIGMGGAVIPANAECLGCHASISGPVSVRPVPVMGHPQEGWGNCTSCHAPERLVDTAPGHSGIHASECTICHQPGDLPTPLSRPHRDNQNVACLSCHGSKAPLPSDMTHRKETVCWLCHRLPTIEPPVPAHQTAPGEADCLTCHIAGGLAGKLPGDHVARPSTLCLVCHEVTLATRPAETPMIVTFPAPSATPGPSVPTPVPSTP
jgi:hypothetical protein